MSYVVPPRPMDAYPPGEHAGEVATPQDSRSAVQRWPAPLMATLSWLLVASCGCSGEVRADLNVVPPDPVPQPTQQAAGGQAVEPPEIGDEDQDGIADDVDQCVGQKEDGLGPDPKDGCESTAPHRDGESSGVGPPSARGSDRLLRFV